MCFRPTKLVLLIALGYTLGQTGVQVINRASAQPAPVSTSPAPGPTPDQAREYHLFPRDMLKITVLNEKDLSVEQRIDGLGRLTLPLLGVVDLKGLSVTEAEAKISSLYIANEILVHPQISITVSEYSPKEISVLGQVTKAGVVELPIESDSISIVEAISKAGGFTRISQTAEVQVTRHPVDGAPDQSIKVDVSKMIDGRGAAAFMVVPGDVIFVPERIF